MFIFDLIVYLLVGISVAYLLRKYKINVFRGVDQFFSPMSKTDIGITFFVWPVIVFYVLVSHVEYYITLPFRRLLNLLIDFIYNHTK